MKYPIFCNIKKDIKIIEAEALIPSLMEMQVEILGHHLAASVSDNVAALEALY